MLKSHVLSSCCRSVAISVARFDHDFVRNSAAQHHRAKRAAFRHSRQRVEKIGGARQWSAVDGDQQIAEQDSGSICRFALGDRYFSYEPYALMLRRGDGEFRLAVNRSLARLYRSGDVLDIYQRWFGSLGSPTTLVLATYAIEGLPE